MTNLVTNDEVKALIDTDRDLGPFIESAHLVVSEELSSSGLSDDRLRLIELYLAAHFVAVTEERGGLTGQKIGDAADFYQLQAGTGIASTRFGQHAITLDTSGTLRTLSRSGATAQFMVV